MRSTRHRDTQVRRVASRSSLVIGLLALAAACGDQSTDEGVLARVGGYAFMVDQAVELLVDEERLAADATVVESLARLWIDYTLLAEAAADDSTFADLDVQPLVLQQVHQRMVFQLRDSVIQVDTFITEDELRARYESDEPALELRASHIMLQLPLGATTAQRDSVRAVLQGLRTRIAGGESFAALARQFSQDPGTARAGGDLGYFQRGDMVAPFENAVLALEPGQVSDVVQTPMGLHLIRLEDRRTPGFAEAARGYRAEVQAGMIQEAESVFVSGLVDRATPRVTEGAYEVVRELADRPGAQLSGRAARRALVEWTAGAVTVGEVREILQMESAGLRTQIARGDDAEVEDFLQSLARRELLIREAEASGLRPPADSLAVLVDDARTQLRNAARRLGLLTLDRAPGERLEVAINRAVERALAGNLSGATQVVPLGLVGYQLREGRGSTVLDTGVGEVIVQIARIRAARSLSPNEQGAGVTAPPDTAGR